MKLINLRVKYHNMIHSLTLVYLLEMKETYHQNHYKVIPSKKAKVIICKLNKQIIILIQLNNNKAYSQKWHQNILLDKNPLTLKIKIILHIITNHNFN